MLRNCRRTAPIAFALGVSFWNLPRRSCQRGIFIEMTVMFWIDFTAALEELSLSWIEDFPL